MEIKGIAAETIPLFIKAKHGEEEYDRWLRSLPLASREIYSGNVLPSKWYPIKAAIIDPTVKMCEMFFGGDLRGAKDIGVFSAEHALTGIYKLFIKLGSPPFIVKKAQSILSSYYRPCEAEVRIKDENNYTLVLTQFEDSHRVVEDRIAGWIESAFQISGAKKSSVIITKSISRGDAATEFDISWE